MEEKIMRRKSAVTIAAEDKLKSEVRVDADLSNRVADLIAKYATRFTPARNISTTVPHRAIRSTSPITISSCSALRLRRFGIS
jgi:hypothetical protein